MQEQIVVSRALGRAPRAKVRRRAATIKVRPKISVRKVLARRARKKEGDATRAHG